MEEPSGEGKRLRSKSVMRVLVKQGRAVRARAVERPKAPEPRMRIDVGWEGGDIGLLMGCRFGGKG
jgi:hypothetical protein